jgi:hypothetical protein
MKIISGGQTGVDRAALDVALKHGIDCGGWCPAGRLDELGKIPQRYPLREMEQGGFADRTLQNVKDSDGTIVICFNKPRGGTQFTIECCEQVNRPHLVINAAQTSATEAATAIGDFVREHKIDILNVAGPRQSEWAGGYDYAVAVFEIFAQQINTTRKRKNFTRSATLSPDRVARRNRPGSKRRASKSKTRLRR